ncbi:MAG: sulfotransferase family 2 domain-containing protein [Candidatus Thiodiazotropha sp.]
MVLLVLLRTQLTTFVERPSFTNLELNKTHQNKSQGRHHIAFLKVHKAGSTTMQNIFFRFGLKHNLTFVLNQDINGYWPDCATCPNKILPVKTGNHFDIFATHTAYHQQSFGKFLPQDKVTVAIVREPFERFVSAAYYYRDARNAKYLQKVSKKTFVHDLVMHSDIYDTDQFSRTKNAMGRDFGFSSSIKETDKGLIFNYLQQLNREFNFVSIMERFEESAVLLKRFMNWTTPDIVYLQKNSNTHDVVNATEAMRGKHRKLNFLDYALYEFFLREFERKIEAEKNEFKEEVEQLRIVLNRTKYFCEDSQEKTKVLNIMASRWNDYFTISKEDCAWMKLSEKDFISFLRKRHKAMQGLD